MLLYLVQHAEAKREDEDPQRWLTDRGFQDIRKVAAHVGGLNIMVNQIFHSSKTRALQTALVLADQLKPEKGVIETDGLAPMDDPGIWLKRLSQINEDVMLVGHMPHLGRLTALLLCGDKDKNIVSFKMAGIVCLGRDEKGTWSLLWMIVPEVVR